MNPTEIKPVYMLISSIVSFVYNLLIWLIIGKKIRVSESNYKARYVNMKTKHTHFFMDLIESFIIIVASVVLWFYPDLHIIDPICAIFLIVIIYFYTIRAGLDSISVLMERAPVEINLKSLKHELKSISGVIEIHDLHV